MKRKGRGFSEVAALTGGVGSTWGFVQAGLDVQTSAVMHRCTLVRAGRNAVGLLVAILYFYFFIGLRFQAGQSTMPCLHKALLVGSNCRAAP
jgi:hypothetical protein